MKTRLIVLLLCCSVSLLQAAPSLQITKPPVIPVPSWTGPVQDPHAIAGQWFVDLKTGTEHWRTHEFHDNVFPGHGGGWASCRAIWGRTFDIVIDAQNNITSFDIFAVITNDTPAMDPWLDGMNSHREARPFYDIDDQYIGELLETKLTAEFAISLIAGPPPVNDWPTGPYRDPGLPYIVATNEDQLAWYCWCPTNDIQELTPPGAYYVPTWDFGNIPPGAAASRILMFICSPPIPPGDPRHALILASETEGIDVLLNRTTSLKISTWLDDLSGDFCVAYPESEPLRGSDCSVFHNIPEPAFSFIGIVCILLAKRIC
jgi:hypothetical protein